jgi:hypothetical protein
VSYEQFNIWHAYSDILTNPTAISQSSYNVLSILYLLCIKQRILYLINNITIILCVTDTPLSGCYNVVRGSWISDQSCRRMIVTYEQFNIWHTYSDILTNLAVILQSSYNVLAILCLLCMKERILYLINDITIILHAADTRLWTVVWVL